MKKGSEKSKQVEWIEEVAYLRQLLTEYLEDYTG